jgi:hypothetical protein
MPKMRAGGRLLAAAASLGLAAAMFYAQDHEPRFRAGAQSPPSTSSTTASLAAAAISALPVGPTDGAGPSVANQAEAELMAANAPTAAADYQIELPPGLASEQGLQIHTIWVERAISMMFLDIKTIGGFRQDALRWHPEGLAVDVMIPNYHTPEGIELGNQIAGFALANAKKWGVLHVIWRQGFYPGIGAPSWTADYGNETANHFDHVHIATDGGGYPTGREKYYLGTMTTG